jgi:hypothetical protein
MRTVHWLFVVSVALFVAGIGFVIAAGRTAQQATPVEAPRLTPAASIKQIMNGITAPAATVLYSAVGTIVNAEGVKEIAPQTDEDWAVVGNSAAALVESGNLLMMEGRAVDNGEWVKMSRAMIDASVVALKAAEAKNPAGILDAGGAVNTSCDNCHVRYQRQ